MTDEVVERVARAIEMEVIERCLRVGYNDSEALAHAAIAALGDEYRRGIEDAAKWHEIRAAELRSKHNPRRSVAGLVSASVHEHSATAIRALGESGQ